MKGRNILRILVPAALIITLSSFPLRPAVAKEPDYSAYDDILAANVVYGLMDYGNLKTKEGMLDIFLKSLEMIAPDPLTTDERFAFYINAYNAWTQKPALEEYPAIAPIKDIKRGYGSPWKIPLAQYIEASFKGTPGTLCHKLSIPGLSSPQVGSL